MRAPIANLVIGWGCLVLVAAIACGPRGEAFLTDPERNPYTLRAKKLIDQQAYAAAAAAYRQAVRENPDFAEAHLELALLCDDKLGDPIAAIYHYRQYLELRPGSSKRQVVEDFIERAKLTVASKLPQSPIADPSELARLRAERAELIQQNTALRARLAELGQQVTDRAARAGPAEPTAVTLPPPLPAGPTAAPPLVAGGPAPLPSPAPPKTHVVAKGDTLYSLALRYYGSRSGSEKIFQANRQTLVSKDQLKIGQTLVIP